MSDRSVRIRTDLSKDKVVHFNVTQDYDFLEILSLKIKQEDTYKLHVSDYGVIVGRVLANNAFGIQGAKVSIFINLDDNDLKDSDITNIYPYTSLQTKDSDGRRYNLLPDTSNDDCYRVVGTFPNKRLVLDDDTYLEVFDKYWKYTTVTNKSGDYMIFGVPCGNQQIHVDIDLSDIGVLSQKPIDFMYKGYNDTLFDNPKQFKDGTNLDNLAQLLSQDNSVHVYPFWGDTNQEEIAISRCDIQVNYTFEPTCVFFGAMVTDNFNNNIGDKCSASKYAGFNRNLVAGEGTIEMIRKTPDGLVEEFQIQGNRLIDSDGVWCYQIPMNLDYVGTDEFGNIVPTDDPKKGIPTRTCVRFRVSMQETNSEGVGRHRAKYLIPNVQKLTDSVLPQIESGKSFDKCYEFGSATPDEYYRDLYWNKVYSVKNYIPRLQTNKKANTQNYSALRSTNLNNNLNPIPFNHGRFRLNFAYRVLCMLMTIIFAILCGLNAFLSNIVCLRIKVGPFKIYPFKFLCSIVSCISIGGGLTEDEDSNIEYFPCCKRDCKCMMSCSTAGCQRETDYGTLMDVTQQSLSQEYDTVNLDFYNDWLNGTLYMPLWYWKKTKKKKYLFGLFSKKAVNRFCNCAKNFPKLRITNNCDIRYNDNFDFDGKDISKGRMAELLPQEKTFTRYGVIKEFENNAGLKIYYYAPGIPTTIDYKTNEGPADYVRLYSTDIILLGTLNSCDLDSYPNPVINLPTTTANIPFIATIKQTTDEEDDAPYMEGTTEEKGYVEVTGMDWLNGGESGTPKYGGGLFMDLACNYVTTIPKTCINMERMCELGVVIDSYVEEPVSRGNNLTTNIILADGMITRYELVDNETRAMFASLNYNGLNEKIYNQNNGYYGYKLKYIYPTDFDGRLKVNAEAFTNMMEFKTFDNKDESYINFRFGGERKHFYSKSSGKWSFPLYDNSFYFYFGLNEGSTAIDKFNKKYYSTCYRNTKYPFTTDIDNEPGKWCYNVNNTSTDFAVISVLLNGIKTPYSYTLSNEFNEELVSESGMYINELKFGIDVVNGGGEYVVNDNGYVKNGKLKEFLTGEEVKDSEGNSILFENSTYRLSITDANGNNLTQSISVEQVPISLTVSDTSLGNKYYNEISKVEDFCDKETRFYGDIIISNVVIDGLEYKITNINGSNGIYEISCQNGNDIQKVEMIIEQQDKKTPTFNECTCNGVDGIPIVEFINGLVTFHIWKPDNFKITVTQVCNGTPNDNTNTMVVSVKNGEPFNAYINGVPLRFILGKIEDYRSYNTKFYNSNGVTTPQGMIGWFNTHKEDSYKFLPTESANTSVWSDFITATNEVKYKTNNDGEDEELGTFMSDSSILNALKYKFTSMFNLSKIAYVADDTNSTMTISHTGGKGPIMYRGNYPVYSDFSGDETPNSPLSSFVYDSYGYTTLESKYPNIVGNNYTYIDSESGVPRHMDDEIKVPYFNKLYNAPTKIGNYFAAFTENAHIKTNANGNCNQDTSKTYQQSPYRAKHSLNRVDCPNYEAEFSEIQNVAYKANGNFLPYFRGEFVDRRLDYNFVVITPYSGEDVIKISNNNGDENWMKGRISGNTLNGIEMIYNNTSEYLIIDGENSNLEYNYTYNIPESKNAKTDSITSYNNNDANKRFYKTTLKCGNKSINLNDAFWSTNRKPLSGETQDIKAVSNEPLTNGDIFAYNHSSDKNMYNGDFSESNYPMKRLLDVGNLPSCEKLTFNCSSCSYDIELGVEDIDDSGKQKITGSTSEIGETEFIIDCRNMITPVTQSLDECAKNNKYSILFEFNNGTIATQKTFVCVRMFLYCKVKNDTYNSTHYSYSEFPRLMVVKKSRENKNLILEAKKQKTLGNLINFINDNSFEFGYSGDSVSNISDKKIGKKRLFGEEYTYNSKIWVENDNDKKIAYDDDTNVKNVVYKFEKQEKDADGLGWDVIGIFIRRNYINSEDDNLTKNISTYQFTSLYDVRKFDFTCIESEIVEFSDNTSTNVGDNGSSADGTGSGGGSGSVNVPSIDEDEEGNVTTSSTSSNVDVDVNVNLDIDLDLNLSGETKTLVQRTKFRIKTTKNDINLNQQFISYDSLSVIFKLDGPNKFTNNVTISAVDSNGNELTDEILNGNSNVDINIDFDILWTGDLANYFVTNKEKHNKGKDYKSSLYISMPNKLIYRIDFILKKHNEGEALKLGKW